MNSELYRAWKAEKSSSTTQPLPSDFYRRTDVYLRSLTEEANSSEAHTVQGRLLMKEKTVAERLLLELREMRLRKIIESAKGGRTVVGDGLTNEEQDLVKTLGNSIASFKNHNEPSGETPSQVFETELVVVRFLQDIPEIVGVDLKIYGPYKKEDVGSLPSQNAEGLIKQGAAKPIDVGGIQQIK
jgi:DNA replication factor GINS